MPDSIDLDADDNREAILAEILALRQALAARMGAGPDCAPDMVILRPCPGLTLDAWDKLARDHELRDWLAMPMRGHPLPYLRRIQKTILELAHLSEHDHLTGLSNRASFERTLAGELERACRNGTSLSLAILDLDDFKAINDTHGHLCGDVVLRRVAEVLSEAKRTYDFAARIGGEEFAMLLPGLGLTRSEIVLRRALAAVEALRVDCGGGITLRVTASAGLACTKGKVPLRRDDLFLPADQALYEAKAQGKNRLVKAPLVDLTRPAEKTLVGADEKKYLFTGS
ncbi:GGDEF domain-containing protein [Desulfolutivibrio sulfoxidireducens]|uniref:GGDEF domain-containing protein n=1 Tax=Desulfolutivibrio sulfoxidireducens TaxID=2773299 RepID=UPI00159CFE5F|nr:GGDEF domain-containing protein [Desulfolutivibrio sulfoxidireducens]QLA16712.1 diguanylate cyclase [Desulfolutivibrio sulfoxidireducens]QLA19412.1 diguanylate cyclase [Desulfolutivibrio sulfoxidireducens]